MTNNLLQQFINDHCYDVRVTGNGRWIDQKCAFDAVCFVADCIVDYIHDGGEMPFTSPAIWHRPYSIENVMRLFGKPDPTTRSTMDEYNKFFRQPLKMLAAAGVLSEKLSGITIEFSVVNMEVMEYIALRERNALDFVCMYIEKALKDSGLWDGFASFFDEQTQDWYEDVKYQYEQFCFAYTPINTKVEADRIFTKVLNQLAFKYHKRGTERGRISKNIITLQDIVYNKTNWYDDLTGKDKNVARGDYSGIVPTQNNYDYQVARAMKKLKYYIDTYFDSEPEVRDRFSIGHKMSALHHIFPRHQFPELAAFYENLIALTTAQHMQEAHPGGNTHKIDPAFQYTCLIAKTDSIRRNLLGKDNSPTIYSFEDFMYVLDTGLKTDYFSSVQYCDFNAVLQGIELNF